MVQLDTYSISVLVEDEDVVQSDRPLVDSLRELLPGGGQLLALPVVGLQIVT